MECARTQDLRAETRGAGCARTQDPRAEVRGADKPWQAGGGTRWGESVGAEGAVRCGRTDLALDTFVTGKDHEEQCRGAGHPAGRAVKAMWGLVSQGSRRGAMARGRRVPGCQMTRDSAVAAWGCGAGAESGTDAGSRRARTLVPRETGARGGSGSGGVGAGVAIGQSGRRGWQVAWSQSRGWTGGRVGGWVPCRGSPRRRPRRGQHLPQPWLGRHG